MKTIATLIFIACIQNATFAQASQTAKAGAENNKSSVMIYSADEDAIVYKNASQNGKEIIIESLPGFGQEAIPVDVSQNVKGSYTFKKDPALLLPEYYSVVIEDTLTGKSFDLKAADSYTFDVSRATPERFVLKMSKSKTTLTAMR
jgi:hypothetical protein